MLKMLTGLQLVSYVIYLQFIALISGMDHVGWIIHSFFV